MDPLIPDKQIGKIYKEAAVAARMLREKCSRVALVLDKDDPAAELMSEYQQVCLRFQKKAEKAADMVLMILNDGALRDYCQSFDKVFKQFVDLAQKIEHDVNTLENQSASTH